MATELNDRAQHLLKVLIEHYIRGGQPVGSKTLARDSGLDISPATVRNVMADLESLGFVTSPHTSAGRIPTDKGYRLFVDTLLTTKPLDEDEISRLKEYLEREDSIHNKVSSVSELISGITSMACLITLPRERYLTLKHIEFISLSESRILVILVVNDQEVRNIIIRPEREFSQGELQGAANYLNNIFVGKDMDGVRRQILAEMRRTRDHMDKIMKTAITLAEQAFTTNESSDNYVMAGQTNLMDFNELFSIEKLREIFEAFNEKQRILHLLDQCVLSKGIQIYIGKESGYQVFNECSLVTSHYTLEGKVMGSLSVIGPTRMAYERVIPLVDMTAKMMSITLNSAS